jgi:uncharacterized cofD-like protein
MNKSGHDVMAGRRLNLLTVGGGSGQFVLLSGLRDLEAVTVTAVVSMVDSGGSTGRLRDELGILPPGDVLKCILALSPYRELARKILLKRFVTDRRLQGHTAGNMLLTMLSRYTGSFPRGVQALGEILDIQGQILPVTVYNATLVAELTDGSRVFGEEAIDIPRGTQREKIREVYLVPHHSHCISVYPPVIDAITRADYILIGPGDLFTSVLPNIVVPGVKEALQSAKGKILYVLNLMTKFGETHNFLAFDFIEKLEEGVGRQVHGVICNTVKPSQETLHRYRDQKAEYVEFEEQSDRWGSRRIYGSDLLDTTGGLVRHDPEKLAKLILQIISETGSQCIEQR